ncbi:type VI secretion system protein TssA [Aliagarivorans marinus]|uniref:type VI secretion system protein TssA n=1 Tax=Aliagarivorans marinus TaxID=561965 RepID=UPI000405B950|nr:type VI secretion system protein TssA [Aliagarivorans marinus]
MRLPNDNQPVDDYIQHHFGVPLERLIAPVGDNQVGESVRHNGVYFNIKNARKADDPSLPLGVWSHELKVADWHEVQKIALDALSEKCKDLQLGVWLLESNIHLHGYAGIAPAMMLILQLCEKYWDSMHPQMEDGDLEYRTNPINWINEKLTLQLRLVKITDTLLDGEEYCWDEWENALRYQLLQSQNKFSGEWDGPTPRLFKQRLAATAPAWLQALHQDLDDAKRAIDALQQWFDNTCEQDSPSLNDLRKLVNNVNEMICSELQRRGVALAGKNDSSDAPSDDQPDGEAPPSSAGGGGGGPSNGELRDRADAFVLLRRAAEFLMEDDPHSPVPYLVYTACSWGEMSAPDLYQQLFLQQGGQLNIFEVMGLEVGNE